MFTGKNVFTNVGSEKIKRRPSQFDRVLHRVYAEPRNVSSNQFANRVFHRLYWTLRAIQFKIFYSNEELDVDDLSDRWEVGIQPPSLDEMVKSSHFDPQWIKYMYARFKNECPTGRMREPDFRRLLSSIIASEKATDQYISRLFHAFSSSEQKMITFQNLVECLSLIHPQTPETNAQWTIRLITGSEQNCFAFPEFLSFTQSVFGLNEGKKEFQDLNKETVHQRASTIFRELDCNDDGHVTTEDMVRFFKTFERTTMKNASCNQMKQSNSLSV